MCLDIVDTYGGRAPRPITLTRGSRDPAGPTSALQMYVRLCGSCQKVWAVSSREVVKDDSSQQGVAVK
jgi:hypothetical protein